MGFFDDVWSAVSDPVGTAKKVVKGVKRGAEKAVKGIKNVGRTIKKEVEGLADPKAWEQGAQAVAKTLKAPQEWVEKNDPLRKLMPDELKGFSPLSFASGIVTAPISGAGTIVDIASDKKKRKKLASGDADTIIDAVGAGLSLVPVPGAGGVATKAGSAVAKGTAKAVGKAVGKKVAKGVAKKVAKKVVKKGAKETAKKVAKKVGRKVLDEAVGKGIEAGVNVASKKL